MGHDSDRALRIAHGERRLLLRRIVDRLKQRAVGKYAGDDGCWFSAHSPSVRPQRPRRQEHIPGSAEFGILLHLTRPLHRGSMCKQCSPNPGAVLLDYEDDGSDFGDIGDMRRRMGSNADRYTDAELTRIRELLTDYANAAFLWWQRRRHARQAEKQSHTTGAAASPASPP